jgi:uracil-DNA glycosylase family 4
MKLPLYPRTPQAIVACTAPLPFDHTCARCELHVGCKSVCMTAEQHGGSGGLLVVGEYPTVSEDAIGRPMAGGAGAYMRPVVQRYWSGPVTLTNAILCAPRGESPDDKDVEACRPYLARILSLVKPERVILMGGTAYQGFLGRKPPALSVHCGNSWYFDDDAMRWVPVFFAVNPAMALRNRFVQEMFDRDVKHACQSPIPQPPFSGSYTVVETQAEAGAALADCIMAGQTAFDTETSGKLFTPSFRVETISFWPVGPDEGYTFDRNVIEAHPEWVNRILSNEAVCLTGSNTKYDLDACKSDPLLATPANIFGDIRIWRKMIEGGVSGKLEDMAELVGLGGHKKEAQAALKDVCYDITKMAGFPHLAPLKSGKQRKQPELKVLRWGCIQADVLEDIYNERLENMGIAYRYLNSEVRCRYNARDAHTTAVLAGELWPQIKANTGWLTVWKECLLPAISGFSDMEETGALIDRVALEAFNSYLLLKIGQCTQRMNRYGEINWGSSVQLAELLYDKLKLPLPRQRRNKPARSTDADTLEILRGKHPVIADIEEFRRLDKLRGTYAEGWLRSVGPDSRAHPSVLIFGADTARPSCSDPNFFTIPRPKDEEGHTEGQLLRDVIVAPDGWNILEADYSQVELRGAALLSGDPVMTAIYKEGVDLHQRTTDMILPTVWPEIAAKWTEMSAEDRAPYRTASKTCIAEGELVLTKNGLVPIENLDNDSLVWDGVEWVAHEGLIFKGYRKVMFYGGLTATPDHRVYMQDGKCVPFAVAAMDGHLAVGGDGKVPIRYFDNDRQAGSSRPKGTPAYRMSVLRVPERVCHRPIQHHSRPHHKLSLSARAEVSRQPCGNHRQTLSRDARQVYSLQLSHSQALWLSRHRMQVLFVRGVRPLGAEEPAASYVQGSGYRPAGQQRSLRAWKSSASDEQNQPRQQAHNSLRRVLRRQSSAESCVGPHQVRQSELSVRARVHRKADSQRSRSERASDVGCPRRWSKVYDIVNAGPRHRFTVSGKIVANCNFAVLYDLPEQVAGLVSMRLKVKKDVAESIVEAILGKFKRLRQWMVETLAVSRRTGTALIYWPIDGKMVPVLERNIREIAAQGDDAEGIRMNAERSAANTPIQGSFSGLPAQAAIPRIQRRFHAEMIPAHIFLSVYDSIEVYAQEGYEQDAGRIMREEMLSILPNDPVPFDVDFKIGKRLGSMKSFKLDDPTDI